jgi:hypothetical protein
MNRDFFQKSGFVTFLPLLMSNFMQKIRKIVRAVLEKNWYQPTNQPTNQRTLSPTGSTKVENCNVDKGPQSQL